jgi:hypothetical protein
LSVVSSQWLVLFFGSEDLRTHCHLRTDD